MSFTKLKEKERKSLARPRRRKARCAILLTSGGIVKGGCPPLVFIPPFDTNLKIMARSSRTPTKTGNSGSRNYDSQVGDFGNVTNPYTGLSVPDPRDYLLGTDAPGYQYEMSKYEHMLNDNMWSAQLAIMANDRAYAEEMYNKYNSPAAQVEQMRAAGLNPDLQGISPQGMSAPQASIPNTGGLSQRQSINFAKEALTLLPQAISIYTGMKGSLLTLESQELNLLKGADEIAKGEIGRQFTIEMLNDPTSVPLADLSHIKNNKFRGRVADAISRYTFDFRNRAQAKGFVYNANKFGESERQGFLGLLGNFGYSVDDDTFVGIIKDLNDITKGLDKVRAEKETEYYNNINLANKAGMENSQWSMEQTKADNDLYTSLLEKASGLMDSENKGERIRGTILYILALLTQLSPSFSHTPKGNTWSIQ